MAVRSDRLAGPVAAAAGATTPLFEVPAGETWLVKRICAFDAGVVGATVFWRVQVFGVVATPWVSTPAVARAEDREVWWALDAGCELKIDVLGANVVVLVFGAKLAGVAP